MRELVLRLRLVGNLLLFWAFLFPCVSGWWCSIRRGKCEGVL